MPVAQSAGMTRRIIFLLNPIAGRGNKSPVSDIIEQQMADTAVSFEIQATLPGGDYQHIRHRIVSDGVTDVVIAGGDGTINTVVGCLRDTGVNFGLIPCGSGNGLAFCAGIPKHPVKAINLILSGTALPTDAFLINDKFSCMLSGLGFDAQVAHDFALQGKRGLFNYVRQTYSNFLKARTYNFDVTINNESFSTDAFFISVANSNQFGNRFTIAPKASLTDGLLDIVIVQKMNKPYMLLAILNQIRKGKVSQSNVRHKGILYYQTPELHIRNHDFAPLHIDGDPEITSDAFRIRVLPAAFRLIRP